jgi:hypothetical protein
MTKLPAPPTKPSKDVSKEIEDAISHADRIMDMYRRKESRKRVVD